MREPYCLRKDEIGELTPREIFDIYFAPRDRETGAVLANEEEQTVPVETIPDTEANGKPVGIRGVGGLGLKKYDCWKPQPGEVVGDVFSISREIARQRIESMLYEVASKGAWEGGVEVNLSSTGQTICRPPIKRTDRKAIRDFVDFVWAKDCEEFERKKRECPLVTSEVFDGVGRIMRWNVNGRAGICEVKVNGQHYLLSENQCVLYVESTNGT